jgi:hypothetical protein
MSGCLAGRQQLLKARWGIIWQAECRRLAL